ncbi:MAG: UvrD-helicase domain-containing protein [Verrucomicrobiota bacterium]|nr:UvrD-helicase domain-containing protein [Verrucomicrobiota bacterium]
MSELNPAQQEAARHVEGPLLVLAGAGSGKTRVVTHRIAHLIELGIVPSDILAVTFTNKAAEEMRSRIRALKNAQVLACTFHSLGARILRESIELLGYRKDFAIYDEDDSEKLLRNCLQQLQLTEEKGLLKEMRAQISTAKNNLHPPEKAEEKLFASVYVLYQSKLKECNALDFDDLLYLTVRLLQENEHARREYQNRWLFVLIDEYQDTNFAQYTLAKLLVEQHRNIFAVGDPDQSIYSWRGARYQNILNFEQDFPGAKVITLEQNYRSTDNILQASNALIEHNLHRYEKKLWSANGEGEKIRLFTAHTERQEAEFIGNQILRQVLEKGFSYDDIAIFYRTNAQSRPFEDALLAGRIPYQIIGGLSFYARREIKDILSFLRLVISNTDIISFLRTINIPKRGLGPVTLEKILALAAEKKMSILHFCEELIARPDFSPKLSAKQHSGLKSYIELIHRLRNQRPSLKIHELIAETIAQTQYLNYLKEDPETEQDRKENLDELIGKAAEWEEEREDPTLLNFLEELSLRSSTDETTHLPAVKLMTLHNSKGLEFPLVFVVGLEEDICPHANSKGKAEAIEEERRLFYVGMTRAKRLLYLTAASSRFLWGTVRTMTLSRFLKEIPAQFLNNLSPHSTTEESPSPGKFSSGDKVYHQQFGMGIVQKSFEGSFGLTYEVLFPQSGTTRSLVARFAKLQPYSQ